MKIILIKISPNKNILLMLWNCQKEICNVVDFNVLILNYFQSTGVVQ